MSGEPHADVELAPEEVRLPEDRGHVTGSVAASRVGVVDGSSADAVPQEKDRGPSSAAVLTQHVATLKQQLRKQRFAAMDAALLHEKTLALRAWATHALLARQRSKHQEKLAKTVTSSAANAEQARQEASRRELQLLATVSSGRRLRAQRTLFQSWASTCRRAGVKRAHRKRESPRVTTETTDEAQVSKAAHTLPASEPSRSRVYSLEVMLMLRERASKPRLSPPGLDVASASDESPGFRLLEPPPGLSLPSWKSRRA